VGISLSAWLVILIIIILPLADSCLSSVCDQVYMLMIEPFHRFKKTEPFKRLLEEIGIYQKDVTWAGSKEAPPFIVDSLGRRNAGGRFMNAHGRLTDERRSSVAESPTGAAEDKRKMNGAG
jgi:hypothetical protein